MIFTEYMAGTNNRTFENSMPMFQEENVIAINWGSAGRKRNTIYAWDTTIESGKEPEFCFQDVFRKDGPPYNQNELDLIKRLNKHK